jgi:hypothetical protein
VSTKKIKNIGLRNSDVIRKLMSSADFKSEINDKITRETIEKLGSRVSMTDSDEEMNLQLFCYVRCGPEDENIVKQCRGIVFNNENIVMQAFPYTNELSHTAVDEIEKNIGPNFENCTVFDSYEGTLIRVFNFSGKWFTSTHRKLNAFRSKWSSKESFGTSFKRALEFEVENNPDLKSALPENEECLIERFQSILDPNKQYMFLVLHNEENRIVCDAPENPTLFHVGTFVNNQLVMNEDIYIPRPKQHNFTSLKNLVNYVNNINVKNIQGVIIFAPDNKQYKILHSEYLNLFQARGNEPSIKYRYLQVRMNRSLCDILYYLYPNMTYQFEEYENTIYKIAQIIYTCYVNRYIKKQWVTVEVEEFNVMRKCHSLYEADRKNRITLNKVNDILNQQTPTNLNKMIRRFQNEKKINNNQNVPNTFVPNTFVPKTFVPKTFVPKNSNKQKRFLSKEQ